MLLYCCKGMNAPALLIWHIDRHQDGVQ